MAIEYTEQQTRVLNARKHNILVSAAAGSGKTAVLAERIVRMISEGDAPLDIDRLLVVTFTKAAAAQMRERIGAAIAGRLEEDPDNVHLQRQETLLHNAQITTMDSFFTFLLRNNFSEIDLDPGFRQMDQTEADLMRKDAMEDFLEEGYAGQDPSLLLCADYFCRGSNDRELEDILDSLYRQAVSHPDPGGWLRDRASDYDVSGEKALFSSVWMQFVILTAAEKIADLKRQYEQILSICMLPEGPSLYIPLITKELESVSIPGPVPSADKAGKQGPDEMKALWGRILEVLSMEFENLPRFTAGKYPETDPGLKDTAVFLRNSAKSTIQKLRKKYSGSDPESILREMDGMKSVSQALSDLSCRFLSYFAAVKKEKNVIDFADLEHLALAVLSEKGEDGIYRPGRAAMEYRQYFDEILIDEYQDSNEVQELLLRIISTEEEGRYNRFMVGDVKQSIYKFRLARPEIFMEKLDTYKAEDPETERIDLDRNFRSRAEVLESVNEIFFRLMRREIGGIEYTGEAALKVGASYPQPDVPGTYKTEILLVEGPAEEEKALIRDEILQLGNRQKEALAVAGRIRRLVGSLPVRAEEGDMRPCRYGDIVVLLRSGTGWNEDFRSIFEKQGIPYYIESKTGYFSSSEIQGVLELVRVLDNPMQDIPLYGVLHGYWGRLGEEEIAQIRLAMPEDADGLYGCLRRTAEGEDDPVPPSLREKCRDFLHFLESWRKKTVYLNVCELLNGLIYETGYEEWCRALPGGEQRSANLRMLLSQAEAFDAMGFQGLFDFVRYIDQMHHREVDYGEANILDESADVVRIMSIHKSKGLEFPVCIVAGTGKKHSFRSHDTKGSLICDNDWGIGMDYWSARTRRKHSTARKEAIADKIRRESLGEELRVLYVAMTRAKEKLILTGYLDNAAKKCGDWEKRLPLSMGPSEKLPIPLLSESESFLELIWYAVPRDTGNSVFEISHIRCADLVWNEMEQQADMGIRLQRLEKAGERGDGPLPDPVLAQKLEDIYARRYAYEDLRGLYTKTSVSELKKASMEEENGEGASSLFPEILPSPTIPSFAADPGSAADQTGSTDADSARDSGRASDNLLYSGTAYGTAVHKLLELFDYRRFPDPAAVTARDLDIWRDELFESGRIPRSYVDNLPVRGILAFLKSSLASRMAAADLRQKLFREQPFVLGIEADRLNPGFPADETVLVQGIIDAFLEEEKGLVLVDYKTDRVTEERELIERYQIQLDLYQRALEQITGKKVFEKLIYSVTLQKTIHL